MNAKTQREEKVHGLKRQCLRAVKKKDEDNRCGGNKNNRPKTHTFA